MTPANVTSLNLTMANLVYILEPQWNPTVEEQAIARVLRLGQKREVRVIRYIMRSTIEEVRLSVHDIVLVAKKLTSRRACVVNNGENWNSHRLDGIKGVLFEQLWSSYQDVEVKTEYLAAKERCSQGWR